jgi:hypothetical protein
MQRNSTENLDEIKEDKAGKKEKESRIICALKETSRNFMVSLGL